MSCSLDVGNGFACLVEIVKTPDFAVNGVFFLPSTDSADDAMVHSIISKLGKGLILAEQDL